MVRFMTILPLLLSGRASTFSIISTSTWTVSPIKTGFLNFQDRTSVNAVSVPVIDIFLDEESQGLAMLSDFIEKPISLKAEPSYLQEQYDIVLL